jgi:hypothetical protein
MFFIKLNCLLQGSRLAVSRYPRDTRFQFWILDIIGLVSQRDTKKNRNIGEVRTSRRNVRQNNIFFVVCRAKTEWT